MNVQRAGARRFIVECRLVEIVATDVVMMMSIAVTEVCIFVRMHLGQRNAGCNQCQQEYRQNYPARRFSNWLAAIHRSNIATTLRLSQ